MKKIYSIILVFLSAVILLIPGNVSAQKEKLIEIKSVVTDKDGKPVPNAELFSGTSFTRTDASGKFSIGMEAGSKLIVEANAFETITLTLDEAKIMTRIKLVSTKFL